MSGLSPTSLACSTHRWNLIDKIVWSGKLSAKQRIVSPKKSHLEITGRKRKWNHNMLYCGRRGITCLSTCTYQRQHEVEKGSPTVEEDGQQRRDSGEKQAHVPAHDHPQRL